MDVGFVVGQFKRPLLTTFKQDTRHLDLAQWFQLKINGCFSAVAIVQRLRKLVDKRNPHIA